MNKAQGNQNKAGLKDKVRAVAIVIGVMTFTFIVGVMTLMILFYSGEESMKGARVASAHSLATMGTDAAPQPVILHGRCKKQMSNLLTFEPIEVTKSSRTVSCEITNDGRVRTIQNGDMVTISGYVTHTPSGNILIKNCQFHGKGNRALDVKESGEYLRK
ncbi:MAG: hypothetical protein IJ165_13295 [Proteobacteria bacterium]|nr:hypothetical protein [Pseudomonadota bacterium]